jgi:hypothetical protein
MAVNLHTATGGRTILRQRGAQSARMVWILLHLAKLPTVRRQFFGADGHNRASQTRIQRPGVESVDKTEDKGSDVNWQRISWDAFPKNFEIANDSKLAQPGYRTRTRGTVACLKSISTFSKRIRQADLIASQFPPILADGKSTFRKPAGW